MTLRQVYFASLDLALHSQYEAGKGSSVFSSPVVRQVIEENTVVPPLPEDRFLNAFQHIFAGGYSAGELNTRLCKLYNRTMIVRTFENLLQTSYALLHA